jgi:hypothetical protein
MAQFTEKEKNKIFDNLTAILINQQKHSDELLKLNESVYGTQNKDGLEAEVKNLVNTQIICREEKKLVKENTKDNLARVSLFFLALGFLWSVFKEVFKKVF